MFQTLRTLRLRRYVQRGGAALAALLFAAAPASAQVVFDTFDDGDVTDVGVFSGTGGGIGVGPTDGQTGAANTALSVGIDPAGAGGFAGIVIPGGAGTTDVSAQRSLTFYVRPTTVQAANLPLTLEINLHEDVNGNGTYEGNLEDEFQANYALAVGAGYTQVTIPLTSFADDNAVFPGANDGFDYSRLLEIVVAIAGPTGPEFAFAIDDVVFTMDGPPPPGPITEFDFFDDGDVTDVGVFSGAGGGIGVGPIDDANGIPDRALNVGIDPAGTGSFAGFVVPGSVGVTDVSGLVSFNFQVRPNVVAGNLPLTLEINLHEDVNGNGTYEGNLEDEYQATYAILGPSGYLDVSIPLTSFTDDNSVFPGANDGFDYANLLEIVVAIGGPTGPGYSISFDQFGFAAPSSAAEGLPAAFAAAPVAFPNPTAGAATVAFELRQASDVTVDVVDVLGRRVVSLGTRPQAAGAVRLAVPSGGLAPGLYLVRVRTEAGVATTRLTVTR